MAKKKSSPGVRHESMPQDIGSDSVISLDQPCAFCGTSGIEVTPMMVRQENVYFLCAYCQCIPLPANLLGNNITGIIAQMDMLRMHVRLMQTMEQRVIEALT